MLGFISFNPTYAEAAISPSAALSSTAKPGAFGEDCLRA
jgi:hypothetical protein